MTLVFAAFQTNKGYIIYYKVVVEKPKASFFGSSNDEDPWYSSFVLAIL
jgi:hypothetical protein